MQRDLGSERKRNKSKKVVILEIGVEASGLKHHVVQYKKGRYIVFLDVCKRCF